MEGREEEVVGGERGGDAKRADWYRALLALVAEGSQEKAEGSNMIALVVEEVVRKVEDRRCVIDVDKS